MKTFVFFIGGTGARVLRSLTMLMASGVELKKGDSIVPIMVDYDATNADSRRTNELLSAYNEFRGICQYDTDNFEGGFFKTPLGIQDGKEYSPMDSLVAMSFDGDKNTFGGYIGYDALALPGIQCETTKYLIDSLYDTSDMSKRDRELNLELQYGFKGNPNIGSVVFNEYFKTGQFKNFKNNFRDGDRIFIVASIFGGTGSSGLPQLVKKIRETAMQQVQDSSTGVATAIRDAMLGACVVLPYFSVQEDEKSAINSLTFNSKAKAALNYYHEEINNDMSEVFYIGCKDQGVGYVNHEGGEEQKNNAHIVELLAAMSIVEFANHDVVKPGDSTLYYEYTSTSYSGKLPEKSFLDLLSRPNGSDVYQKYLKKMNAFALFVKYFREYTRAESSKWRLNQNSYYRNLEDYLKPKSDFSEKLMQFTDKFIEWTKELSSNSILKFYPYDFDASKLYELIKIDDSNNFKKHDFDNVITGILNQGNKNENERNSNGDKVYLRHAYIGCMEAVSKIN